MRISEFQKHYLSDTVSKELLSFARPTLSKLNVTYFGFDRIFDDGTCIRVTTHPEAVKTLLESQCPITINLSEELRYKEKVSVFLADRLDLVGYTDFDKYLRIREIFRIGTGVEFIHKGKNYYDQFWFISGNKIQQSANVFFSQQEMIEDFIARINARYHDLMKDAKNDRIQLPKSCLSNIKGMENSKPSLTDPLSYQVRQLRKRETVHFTKRETECVALVTLGLTAREIGEFLGLSVRTVEFYTDRIKDKINCEKKGQIVAYANQIQSSRNGDPIFRKELQDAMRRYQLMNQTVLEKL